MSPSVLLFIMDSRIIRKQLSVIKNNRQNAWTFGKNNK